MSTAAAVPQQAAAPNTKTLNEAMEAVSIEEKNEAGNGNGTGNRNGTASGEASDLEDGEIRDGEGDGDDEVEDDGSVKTVFDDARRFNVKHPLYSNWTLYFDSPATKHLPKTPLSTPASPLAHGGWMDDIRKVVAFNSVEEFWGLYNNVIPPSQLPGKANYYLFRDNIMPAWEDSANKDGGKWSIQVPREKCKGVVDKMWLYTMLAAIGETFETPETAEGEEPKPPAQSGLVTGVIMSARPAFYRINIWTRSAPDVKLPLEDELMARTRLIGKHFKTSVLGFESEQKLSVGGASGLQTEVVFESHKLSEVKGNKDKIIV